MPTNCESLSRDGQRTTRLVIEHWSLVIPWSLDIGHWSFSSLPIHLLTAAPMTIRLANAPCSWGVLEFDLPGKPLGYAQVLDEIRDTGYAGVIV